MRLVEEKMRYGFENGYVGYGEVKKWIKWVGIMSGRHARWGNLGSGDNGVGCVDVDAGSES